LKPERKLWQELKQKTPDITWNRIENLALPGIPDLLGYNKNYHFFTVELKVAKSRKVRFSPHQIAFHIRHPKNTYILVKSLASRSQKLDQYFLYEGSSCSSLATCGLSLEARCSGLEACCSFLEKLGA
jgi:Holliday junction resolvase